MIYETVVTTKYRNRFNIAPMGIQFENEDTVLVSPYTTSHTYIGLRETGVCVVNFVDDVEIFAKSVVYDEVFPWHPATFIDGWILDDAYMYMEVEAKEFLCRGGRSTFRTRVLHRKVRRTPYMFNRARSTVVEAAIMISRIGIYPENKIREFFMDGEPVVLKTGGDIEIRAWRFLISILRERGLF